MRNMIGAAVLLAFSVPAAAQSLDKTWLLQASAYFPRVDSSLRVDSSTGDLGTVVDFERDLGFDRHSTLPAFMLEWRPGDDWVLNAEYYSVGRSSTATVGREIEIGDTVYPVNGEVGAGFDSDIVRFTVGNRVFQRPNLEIGFAVGLHGTDFGVFVEGNGSVNGNPGQFRSEARSIFAPLPTIGIFLNARPARKVQVNARFDWLSLTIDDYTGRVINTEASASYSIHRNFDVGVMYRLVDYGLKVRKDDWSGRVDYQFNGPALFLQVG
ncbi:MAG: hypothetical protein ACRC1J_06905, partial [Sandaracinobacteroides sp.]